MPFENEELANPMVRSVHRSRDETPYTPPYTAPSGSVVQVVSTQTGTVATSTAQTPADNTIPQKTEGTEFMTLAITPTNASNILDIEVVAVVSVTDQRTLTLALHQDSTSNALAATAVTQTLTTTIVLRHRMVAGTTNATTFKVRIGLSLEGAATITFNGAVGGTQLYGGVCVSSIKITEELP